MFTCPNNQRLYMKGIGFLFIGLCVFMFGCSNELPFQFDNKIESGSFSSSAKMSTGTSDSQDDPNDYPQYASRTYYFQNENNDYQGGNMNVPGGSTFRLDNGALIPPPETPQGDPVTLTMSVEKIKGGKELLFTFGPSGCVFNPLAEVWFDWSDLGSNNAKLYYIDSSNKYVEQEPETIDQQGHRMTLHISHFSRYALAISR